MATQSESIPEYERKRLENIKRNAEMMSSLKLQSRALELSSATKRNRNKLEGYKTTPKKKPKPETPVVIRRSLRSKGLEPDGSVAKVVKNDLPSRPIRTLGPLTMQEACLDDSFDTSLIGTVLGMSDNAPGERGFLDLDSMVLKPENVADVMDGNICTMKFFPCNDRKMLVAGNNVGDVAFWDVDCTEGENEGIYLYGPHTAPISGISIHPHFISKVFSSGFDGLIRLLDFEKESFGLVYSSDTAILSLTQRTQDANSLYFGEGPGLLNIWDMRMRAGKLSSSYTLHADKINSIDFNPKNTNLMATGSTDGTACIWDLRQIDAGRPKNLKIVRHKRSVQGAYFSPGGGCLATTSLDNHVGMHSGADFRDTSMIYHNNNTGRQPLRAIWGWDDEHIFIGSMEKEVDVISVEGNTRSLRSSDMSAVPSRLAAHPHKVGTLAAATYGGQIYLWTQN